MKNVVCLTGRRASSFAIQNEFNVYPLGRHHSRHPCNNSGIPRLRKGVPQRNMGGGLFEFQEALSLEAYPKMMVRVPQVSIDA